MTLNRIIVLPAELSAAAVLINYWISPDRVSNAAWISICIVVCVTINLFGARAYGEAEFWFASIKVITITGLIVSIFSFVCETLSLPPCAGWDFVVAAADGVFLFTRFSVLFLTWEVAPTTIASASVSGRTPVPSSSTTASLVPPVVSSDGGLS